VLVGVLALLVGLLTAATPARAQDIDDLKSEKAETASSIDAATADLDAVRDRIADLTAEVETAAVRLELLDDEILSLQAQVDDAQAEMFALQERIDQGKAAMADRARSIYMNGQASPVMELLTGDDVDTAMDRASLVNLLTKDDQLAVESAAADQANIDAAVEQVHLVQAELVDRQEQAAEVKTQMDADLAQAQDLRDGLEARIDDLGAREAELAAEIEAAEAAAQAAAAAAAARAAAQEAAQEEAAEQAATAASSTPAASGGATASSSGGRACPMNSIPQLFNDWGWPRGGGTRSHQGNDLYGDYREPVFAMASGVWDIQSYGSSAGNWAILRGDDGLHYYYMHLDGHAVGDGARVSVGQQTAYNGWTGNAVGSVYHIHFEIHPGGGGAVDPYPYLAAVC